MPHEKLCALLTQLQHAKKLQASGADSDSRPRTCIASEIVQVKLPHAEVRYEDLHDANQDETKDRNDVPQSLPEG